MSLDLVLRAVSRTMPAASRSRHLEQWRADAAGAAEAGMRPADVARGAIAVALTADRDAPVLTGEPRGAAPRRLSRRGSALVAAVVTVTVALWITGGGVDDTAAALPPALAATLDGARSAVGVVAAVAAVLAALFFASAALLSRALTARIAFACAALGLAALVAAGNLPITGEVMAGLVGLTTAGIVVGLAAAWRATPLALVRRASPLRRRLPLALAGLAVVCVVLVLGGLDTLVWNPMAKVPGVGIDAIYREMIAADGFVPEAAGSAVAVWGIVWFLAATAVTVWASTTAGAWLTPRRLGILYLGIIGVALFLRLFAGFGIGMSIADTFATSGGDVSALSQVFHLVGPVAFATAALLFGWAPSPKSDALGAPEGRSAAIAG